MSARVKQVCRTCKGENVQADAYARWNVEAQEWEISNVFDKGAYCDDCDGETRIEAEEIAERKYLSLEDHALFEDALGRAEAFMSGFEGDETQEGIDEDLEAIRHAQAALGDLPEAGNGQPS